MIMQSDLCKIWLSQVTLIAPVSWRLSDALFSSLGFGAASLSSRSGFEDVEFVCEFFDPNGHMDIEL